MNIREKISQVPKSAQVGISKLQRKEKASLTSSFSSAGNLLCGFEHATSLSWSSKIEENMGKYKFCGLPY